MADDIVTAHARVFKALSDPFRLKILNLLPDTPDCENVYNVNELIEELGGSQPNMSHHLKILKETGLVLGKKMCCSVYFYRNHEQFCQVEKIVKDLKKKTNKPGGKK
jgi:ArsR family transcriptional regulator